MYVWSERRLRLGRRHVGRERHRLEWQLLPERPSVLELGVVPVLPKERELVQGRQTEQVQLKEWELGQERRKERELVPVLLEEQVLEREAVRVRPLEPGQVPVLT